jgi:hypothetical protein
MISNPEPENEGASWIRRYDELRQDLPKIGAATWLDLNEGKLRIEAFWTDATKLASLLRDRNDICGHLQSWGASHDRLEVYVAPVGGDGQGVLRIVVTPDGIAFIDGGDDSEQVQARNFDEWFLQTVSQPFPWRDWGKDFVLLDGNIWGSPGIAGHPISGFPHRLEVATDVPYRLSGFAGHGVNSYAIYVTEERPDLSLRLRLSFGGAYSDPEKQAGWLIADLVEVAHFLDEFGPHFSRIVLGKNISRCCLGLWRAGEPCFRGAIDKLAEMRTRAREALGKGTMPA